jgi:hypothetical protein
MIGIIQKVLLDLLHETGGASLVTDVLKRAEVPEDVTFRIDQNYSDEEFHRLLQASGQATGLPESELCALYARAFLARARELFPRFFEMSSSSEEFLLRQATIHAVMASGLKTSEDRKAVTDKFSAEQVRPGFIRVSYRSANKLCELYKALAHEVAFLYGEKLQITCEHCMKRGDTECRFAINWQTPRSVTPAGLTVTPV